MGLASTVVKFFGFDRPPPRPKKRKPKARRSAPPPSPTPIPEPARRRRAALTRFDEAVRIIAKGLGQQAGSKPDPNRLEEARCLLGPIAEYCRALVAIGTGPPVLNGQQDHTAERLKRYEEHLRHRARTDLDVWEQGRAEIQRQRREAYAITSPEPPELVVPPEVVKDIEQRAAMRLQGRFGRGGAVAAGTSVPPSDP